MFDDLDACESATVMDIVCREQWKDVAEAALIESDRAKLLRDWALLGVHMEALVTGAAVSEVARYPEPALRRLGEVAEAAILDQLPSLLF